MNDDFEKRIERQPFRAVPSEWREEILNAALDSVDAVRERPSDGRQIVPFIEWVRMLFGSQRAGWAALAAVWAVIFALNFSARDDSPVKVVLQTSAPVSKETLQALEQQRLLFAELIGQDEYRAADRKESELPGPHSQRQEETVVV